MDDSYNMLIDLAEEGKIERRVSIIRGDVFVRRPGSPKAEIIKNGQWDIEHFYLDNEWIAERNILTLENGVVYEDLFKTFQGFSKLK